MKLLNFVPKCREIKHIIDRYQARRAVVLQRLEAFSCRERPYLIIQQAPCTIYSHCNTLEQVWEANIADFDHHLDYASDFLPYLEPWVGTGVYASAFGCDYFWRDNDSPAVHYKAHSIDELDVLPEPCIESSPIMQMVLEIIALFRERGKDQLPISPTDTQSANDTATLVLDACELMVGCYEAPERIHSFLSKINDLIIEFTNQQIAAIGPNLLARPGHIMVSDPALSGISISDDNLAVVSANIGRDFCLKYDQALADAFGGLAIHSCGCWQHLMPDVARMRNVVQVDCAIDLAVDPNPNSPEAVRDAFAGSGIAVKARGISGLEPLLAALPRLVHPDLRLIVPIAATPDPEESRSIYAAVDRELEILYGG
ncbi:MAG: uroporphyrinogen decarboxylase family protein [Capsulimonadaceae bacterium]|nr:uroporphyrinogen decarboxylase family protein [Capsulimonadaceae bacterium]